MPLPMDSRQRFLSSTTVIQRMSKNALAVSMSKTVIPATPGTCRRTPFGMRECQDMAPLGKARESEYHEEAIDGICSHCSERRLDRDRRRRHESDRAQGHGYGSSQALHAEAAALQLQACSSR